MDRGEPLNVLGREVGWGNTAAQNKLMQMLVDLGLDVRGIYPETRAEVRDPRSLMLAAATVLSAEVIRTIHGLIASSEKMRKFYNGNTDGTRDNALLKLLERILTHSLGAQLEGINEQGQVRAVLFHETIVDMLLSLYGEDVVGTRWELSYYVTDLLPKDSLRSRLPLIQHVYVTTEEAEDLILNNWGYEGKVTIVRPLQTGAVMLDMPEKDKPKRTYENAINYVLKASGSGFNPREFACIIEKALSGNPDDTITVDLALVGRLGAAENRLLKALLRFKGIDYAVVTDEAQLARARQDHKRVILLEPTGKNKIADNAKLYRQSMLQDDVVLIASPSEQAAEGMLYEVPHLLLEPRGKHEVENQKLLESVVPLPRWQDFDPLRIDRKTFLYGHAMTQAGKSHRLFARGREGLGDVLAWGVRKAA